MGFVDMFRETSTKAVCDSLEALCIAEQAMNITDYPTVKPMVFVSLDLEYNTFVVTQLGISVLDPALFTPNGEWRRDVSDLTIQNSILPQFYSIEAKKLKEFHYGQRQTLEDGQLQALLEEALSLTDRHGHPATIILVGHGVTSDITTLKKHIGYDIMQHPSIGYAIDTSFIARYHFDVEHDAINLKKTLDRLGLSHVHLHNTAHDALFTMRALLMLVYSHLLANTSSVITTAKGLETRRRLELLREVAQDYRPQIPLPTQSNASKKRSSSAAGQSDANEAKCGRR